MATATTAKPRLAYYLNNPCHNCRRRRLRCDRSRPTCNKCSSLGRECLGYDKLFVWTQCAGTGTAARGAATINTTNTANAAITTSIAVSSATTSTAAASPAAAAAGRGGACAGTCTSLRADTSSVSTSSASSSSSSSSSGTVHWDEVSTVVPSTELDARSQPHAVLSSVPHLKLEDAKLTDTRGACVPFAGLDACSQPHAAQLSVPRVKLEDAEMTDTCGIRIPATLTDPLFKDLGLSTRRYLSHFADRVCRDLSAHDGPGYNPFRELVPLSMSHPFLLHIIIATSAVHMSNICQPKLKALPPSRMDAAHYIQHLRTTDRTSRKAFLDSLVAKQRAFHLLQVALKNPDQDGGVLLAAVLFFVNFELIDLGKDVWLHHMHYACRILSVLAERGDSDRFASSTVLLDCIVSDFVIYHILGSTLVSAGLSNNIAHHALSLLPVMERVEADSYLCCPAPILHLILSASQLSGEATGAKIPPSVTASALDLVHRAMAFDIQAWAVNLQPRTQVPDLRSRTTVAMAHRAAVCLYVLQAIPSTRAHSPVTVPELVSEILMHLSHIDEHEAHFKATSWPTFIAGAEAKDESTREWVLGRLMSMWECCPWGYVFAAVEMLRRTWGMRDEGSVDEVRWLQEFWATDMGFLIV